MASLSKLNSFKNIRAEIDTPVSTCTIYLFFNSFVNIDYKNNSIKTRFYNLLDLSVHFYEFSYTLPEI